MKVKLTNQQAREYMKSVTNKPMKKVLVTDLRNTVLKEFPKPELKENIENTLWSYKLQDYYLVMLAEFPEVSLGEKEYGECRQLLEKVLDSFTEMPYNIVLISANKQSTADTYPYNVREFRSKPNVSMLAEVQMRMHEKGYIPDWDNSLIVGGEIDKQLADNANITFKSTLLLD